MKNIADTANFKKFNKLNCIYIDKTEQIYKLIKQNRVFISRPRRFGKSLMQDLIATLFEIGVEPYFKDLWIYDKWNEDLYPVLRLNFLDYTTDNYEKFSKLFYKNLVAFTQKLNLGNIITPNADADEMIFDLIQALDHEKREIVILIDEYDAPLTANINNHELYIRFQNTLRNMYGILKNKECIRFLCITGVTRSKDVEIFSVGSDLKDLSYDTDVSTIIGFTRDEIRKYYKDYINLAVSLDQKIPEEQVTEAQIDLFLDRLAEEYDGYCFDEEYIHKVYSTWSVNTFFEKLGRTKLVRFGDYWYKNGGIPSILANYLKTHTINLEDYAKDLKVRISDFDNPASLLEMKQEVLMCQTGYLTVHSSFSDNNVVALGFPNKEVQRALESLISFNLFPNETFDKEEETKFFTTSTPEEIVNKFNLLMNSISYEEYQNLSERTIQCFLHAFMIGAKQAVLTESHSALGRSDLIVEYAHRRLVFELKYAKTKQECEIKLQEAMKQIQEKSYGDVLPNKEVIKLALVFNGDQNVRQFSHFEMVK